MPHTTPAADHRDASAVGDRLLHWSIAFLAAGLAVAFTQVGEGQAAFAPALAVGVLMVLSCGRRALLPLLVLQGVVSSLQYHGGVAGASIAAVVTTVEIGIVALLLDRVRFRRELATLQDLARLVMAALIGSSLAATVGTALLDRFTDGVLPPWELFQVWFVGDLTGMVLVLPAVGVLAGPWRAVLARVHLRDRSARLEYSVVMTAAVAGAVAVFREVGTSELHASETALLMVSFLPVVWVGARFGVARTALTIWYLDVVAVVAYQGLGPHLFGSTAALPIDLVPVKIATLVVAMATLGVAIAAAGERTSSERERAILRANPAAIAALDRNGIVTVWSGAAERMFGFTEHEAVGRLPPTIPEGEEGAYRERVRAELAGPFERRVEYRRKDGTRLVGHLTTAPLRDADGEVTGILQLVDDLTELVAAEERGRQLQSDLEQSQSDSVALAEVVSRLRREDTAGDTAATLCRAVMGIPGIDAALVLAVHRDGALVPVAMEGPPIRSMRLGHRIERDWTEVVRTTTEAGPWFTSWLDAPRFAVDLADELREISVTATAHVPIVRDGRMLGILVVGTTEAQGPARMAARLPMFDELAAFSALVLSLASGTGGWHEATHAELLEVIAGEQFHPVYQPVVELTTGRVVGYEALTRFDAGTPDQRFGAAVEVGLSAELEAACAAAALRDAKELPRDVWLSINLSPQLVQDERAVQMIEAWNRPIVIEVTEHVVIDDYAGLRAGLARFGDAKVSVDDAGAGYASLRHILELEPQIVKLDVALVRGIDGDRARQALVAGLVHYAKSAGIDLIAEGVETEEEAQLLRVLGVGWGQGYLLGRPGPLP